MSISATSRSLNRICRETIPVEPEGSEERDRDSNPRVHRGPDSPHSRRRSWNHKTWSLNIFVNNNLSTTISANLNNKIRRLSVFSTFSHFHLFKTIKLKSLINIFKRTVIYLFIRNVTQVRTWFSMNKKYPYKEANTLSTLNHFCYFFLPSINKLL